MPYYVTGEANEKKYYDDIFDAGRNFIKMPGAIIGASNGCVYDDLAVFVNKGDGLVVFTDDLLHYGELDFSLLHIAIRREAYTLMSIDEESLWGF